MARNFVDTAFKCGLECLGGRGVIGVNLKVQKIPTENNSIGVKLQDRGGQFQSTIQAMTRLGNAPSEADNVSQAVQQVVLPETTCLQEQDFPCKAQKNLGIVNFPNSKFCICLF